MRILVLLVLVVPHSAPVIKIVSSLPRTGSAKAQTDFIVNGIRMAIDEAGGAAGGFRIEYEDWDSASATESKSREPVNARRAVDDPAVVVYLGTYNSGSAKLSMPILNRAGLLMISPTNTWPGLTKPGMGEKGEPEIYRPSGNRNYCRVTPTDEIHGTLGADWAKDMGVKTVAIVDDGESYGKGVADCFEARCREIGLRVVGRWTAREFEAASADLVYFGGTSWTGATEVAKATTGKLMVPDGCYDDKFLVHAPSGRTYVTAPARTPLRFAIAYRKKFGIEPGPCAVYGYEAARAALKAIEGAGKKDRQAIRRAGLAIRNFAGVFGSWSFDSNGDTTDRTLAGFVVRDGTFVFDRLLGGPPPRIYK